MPTRLLRQLFNFPKTLVRINAWAANAHSQRFYYGNRQFNPDYRIEGIGWAWVWRHGLVTTFWVAYLVNGESRRFAIADQLITEIEGR